MAIHMTDKLREELRAQMGRRNVTQRELARQLGWPQSRVHRLVCPLEVREDYIDQLAAQLGTTTDRLLAAAANQEERIKA